MKSLPPQRLSFKTSPFSPKHSVVFKTMYTLNYKAVPLYSGESTAEERTIMTFLGVGTGLSFVSLAYPLYRGVACYMGQAEHLRSSLNPTTIYRKQLMTYGALHSSFQILGAGGGFKALYYGFTPLLLCVPISFLGFTCAASAITFQKTTEEPLVTWENYGTYLAIVACTEVACAPLRNLHLAMATYPSNEPYPRPTMRQLLQKHPHMWRAGIFPFMTAALIFASYNFASNLGDIIEDTTMVIEEGDEQSAPLTIGTLAFANLGALASHLAYLVGIRNVVDFTRHQTAHTPKYTSWMQPWKFQVKSGWRTFAFGIIATAGLQTVYGFSVFSTQLVELIRKQINGLEEDSHDPLNEQQDEGDED